MAFAWRGGRSDIDEEFVAYYAARAGNLRNTAYLLCGDWHLAEDLTQITFTKLYRAWRRIQRHEVLDQYARRVLLRAFLDERRRPWHREMATVPDSSTLDRIASDDAAPDERIAAGHGAVPPVGTASRRAGAAVLGRPVGGAGRRHPPLFDRNGEEPDVSRAGRPSGRARHRTT